MGAWDDAQGAHGSECEVNMASKQLPGGAGGNERGRRLGQDEPVLAYAKGKGGSLLVATDRRAIIIKAGAAATGQWFGKKNASFGYNQITSVDVHTGALSDAEFEAKKAELLARM